MKKSTILIILAVIGAWFAYKTFFATGRKVTIRYTGASEAAGMGADMLVPLKHDEIYQGTIIADGVQILRAGGIAGKTQYVIPNGQFVIILSNIL